MQNESFWVDFMSVFFAGHVTATEIDLALEVNQQIFSVQLLFTESDNTENNAGMIRDDLIAYAAQLNNKLTYFSDTSIVQSSLLNNQLLEVCDYWQKKSINAFSCFMKPIQSVWNLAIAENKIPNRAQLRFKARDLNKNEASNWDPAFILNAWIVDKIFNYSKTTHYKDSTNITVSNQNISIQWSAIKPNIINAVSYFNHEQRAQYQKIEHQFFSPVINPKTGWRVEFPPSVFVKASSALTANIVMQTALVMSPVEALTWVHNLSDVHILFQRDSTLTLFSEHYFNEMSESEYFFNEKEFCVNYQMTKSDIADYQAPYIAIWISDSANIIRKNLFLSGDNPRWMEELHFWWRKQGKEEALLIDGLAGATQTAASNHICWGGRDHQGKYIEFDEYKLVMEVNREHGQHEIVTIPFVFNGNKFTQYKLGKKEIGRVEIAFKPINL